MKRQVMGQFQKNSLIQTGRKWISIVDHDALEMIALAEEDPAKT